LVDSELGLCWSGIDFVFFFVEIIFIPDLSLKTGFGVGGNTLFLFPEDLLKFICLLGTPGLGSNSSGLGLRDLGDSGKAPLPAAPLTAAPLPAASLTAVTLTATPLPAAPVPTASLPAASVLFF